MHIRAKAIATRPRKVRNNHQNLVIIKCLQQIRENKESDSQNTRLTASPYLMRPVSTGRNTPKALLSRRGIPAGGLIRLLRRCMLRGTVLLLSRGRIAVLRLTTVLLLSRHLVRLLAVLPWCLVRLWRSAVLSRRLIRLRRGTVVLLRRWGASAVMLLRWRGVLSLRSRAIRAWAPVLTVRLTLLRRRLVCRILPTVLCVALVCALSLVSILLRDPRLLVMRSLTATTTQ